MPEGIRRDQFLAWVEALTNQNSPDWLGLPNNAEKVLVSNLDYTATEIIRCCWQVLLTTWWSTCWRCSSLTKMKNSPTGTKSRPQSRHKISLNVFWPMLILVFYELPWDCLISGEACPDPLWVLELTAKDHILIPLDHLNPNNSFPPYVVFTDQIWK